MLFLTRQSVWCYVDQTASDSAEVIWLHKILTIQTPCYNQGRFELRNFYVFNRAHSRFPGGLFPVIAAKCRQANINISLTDERETPPTPVELPELSKQLRSYQLAAVEACLKHRQGIIAIPTAGGKTITAIALALRVNTPVLFLVDERSLLQQTCESYKALTGQSAGILGEGAFNPSQFTVGMFQTVKNQLVRHKDYFTQVGCLIVDEAHVLGARTYYQTVMAVTNAFYRIGLSATPLGRSDKRDTYVIGALGPILYRQKIEALVEDGNLAKAKVLFYRYPGGKETTGNSKWHVLYRTNIVKNSARNRACIRICKITPKPILIFFEMKSHGFDLLHLLRDAGFDTELVCGMHDGSYRRDLVKQLDAHNIDVLLCSRVFNKGVDIPGIRSAINMAGYKAPITAMQRIGRPMRIAEEKDRFVFWDFIDYQHQATLRHSRSRAKVYKAAGLDVVVVEDLKSALANLQDFQSV